MGALPFPDDWATEIIAIHSLEHVHPQRLLPTLSEWRRVLVPGGKVRIHVPNGETLMRTFLERRVEEKWSIMGSLLGMYCGTEAQAPDALESRSDHQLIFDRPLLEWALTQAGFAETLDLTKDAVDRHVLGWRHLVPNYSLVAEATKPF